MTKKLFGLFLEQQAVLEGDSFALLKAGYQYVEDGWYVDAYRIAKLTSDDELLSTVQTKVLKNDPYKAAILASRNKDLLFLRKVGYVLSKNKESIVETYLIGQEVQDTELINTSLENLSSSAAFNVKLFKQCMQGVKLADYL